MMMYLSNIENFFKNDWEFIFEIYSKRIGFTEIYSFLFVREAEKKDFLLFADNKKIPDSTKARKHYELLL